MARWLGIALETVFGTPVTPPATFLDCISIGLKPERETIEIDTGALIGMPDIAGGTYKIKGDIEIIPSSESIMQLLRFMFGASTPTEEDANGRYQHLFLPSDTLKFGTMYKQDDQWPEGTNGIQYTSCICDSLRMEFAKDAPITFTFGVLGQVDAKVAFTAMGTIPAIRQLYSFNAKIYEDLSESTEITNIDSISINYSREIPDDVHAMNDPLLKAFVPGSAKLEGSMDVLFNSWDRYEDFWGATTAPIADPVTKAIGINVDGPALNGVDPYDYHGFDVRMPNLLMTEISEPFERRDTIMQTVGFKGRRGVAEGANTALLAMIVYNSLADVT